MISGRSLPCLLLPCLVSFWHHRLYTGNDSSLLANSEVPDSWHITYTDNHWYNETTMKLYIEKIIVPYIQRKKAEQNLPSSQRALCIMDGFQAQCTSKIVKLLDHHAIDVVYVPANCTGELQPLDLSIDKPIKNFI